MSDVAAEILNGLNEFCYDTLPAFDAWWSARFNRAGLENYKNNVDLYTQCLAAWTAASSRTAPADDGEPAYRVKPLEWIEWSRERVLAKSPFGNAEVALSTYGWHWWFGPMSPRKCESIEDGKAKAEAWCRKRIAAGLELVK